MTTVRSADGTAIAFDRVGKGAPLILVDGALCSRTMGESTHLARLLAPYFTVYTYDRRGRGESGDTAPYAVEREVDDIAALLAEAGGSAFVWGTSSGAVLALDAAQRLGGITKVALYEAPLIVDDSRPPTTAHWVRINEAIAEGRRGDAVKLFLRAVGAPGIFIALLPLLPFWSRLKAVAHTLPYDGAIVKQYQTGHPLPVLAWSSVTIPVLVSDGGRSPVWMRNGNRALAQTLPNARYRTLDRQGHMLKPRAHVAMLLDFFQPSRLSRPGSSPTRSHSSIPPGR